MPALSIRGGRAIAYAFDQINNLLGESEQQKANIFGDQGQAAQQGQQAGQIGEQKTVKTDDSGTIAGGGEGGGTSEGTAAPVVDQKESDRRAVKLNAGKTQQPKAIEGVQNSLTEANNKLQDEANQYTQAQTAKQQYGLSNDDYEKSIASQDPNSAERKKTADLLNRQTINQVDMWKPQTDYEVEDTRLLNNDAGLQELASRGMGPNYTAGEAAFDVRALRKTPGFTNLIRQLQGQQQDLRTNAEKDRAADIETLGKANLASAQAGARDYLTGQESAIDAQNEAEAKAYNDQLAALRANGIGQGNINSALDQARQSALARLDPRYARVAGGLGVDINPYVSIAGDQGRDAFVDNAEAQRFNSIMGLLGQGGPAKSAALPVGPQYSVDQDALTNAMIQRIEAERAAQDHAQRHRLNQIRAGLEQKQSSDAYNRKGSAQNDAARILNELVGGTNALASDVGNQVNWEQFYNAGAPTTAYDYADQGTVDQLNEIYADLGDATRYGVGQGARGAGFNEAAYRDAITSVLRNMGALDTPGAAPSGNSRAGYFDPAREAFETVVNTPFTVMNSRPRF